MKPTKKRKTSTINFGYTFNQETGLLDGIEKEIKELEYVENEILKNNMSLRKACAHLKEKTKRHLSAAGLKKHMDKKYGAGKWLSKAKGEIYIISNPAWKGWIKVGTTLNADRRLSQFQAACPLKDFKLVKFITVKNKLKAERKILEFIKFFAEDNNGEWIKIHTDTAIEILNTYKEKYETH
jgi:Fe-S cluster biosynthesis and repair protein YggX